MYLEILFCLDSSTSSSTDDSNAHDISQTVYAAVFSEYEKTRNAQIEAQNDWQLEWRGLYDGYL